MGKTDYAVKSRYTKHVTVLTHKFGNKFYCEVLHPAKDGIGDVLTTGPLADTPDKAYWDGVRMAMDVAEKG